MIIALRHGIRSLAFRIPGLRNLRGVGLGRLLSRLSPNELITIDGDIVLEVDLRTVSCRSLYFSDGLDMPAEAAMLRHVLSPDDTLVDVGAHFGYFSLIAAKYCSRVIAFEPSPQTYAWMQRNLLLNPLLSPKIAAKMMGMAAEAGTLPLYRPSSNPGIASLRPPAGEDSVVEQVSLGTLDESILDTKVDFLKVDVEGAEMDVLLGGQSTLVRDRPAVYVELYEPFQRRFGRTCQDVVRFLRDLDYEGRLHVSQPGPSPVFSPIDGAKVESAALPINALYVPRERASTVF